MATKIIVNRKSEWMNRVRPVRIFIDSVERGAVANGSSEEFLVEPGMHTMQCKINWHSSAELSFLVNEGETKFLKIRYGMKYYTALYILLLVALISRFLLTVAHIPKPMYFYWIQVAFMIPFIVYLLFYFTIGRKQYLLLEEDKENIFY